MKLQDFTFKISRTNLSAIASESNQSMVKTQDFVYPKMKNFTDKNETQLSAKKVLQLDGKVTVSKQDKNAEAVQQKNKTKIVQQDGKDKMISDVRKEIKNVSSIHSTEIHTKQNSNPNIYKKSSPFYGMLYRNEYGTPLNTHAQVEKFETSQHDWELWKSHFSDLFRNIQKLREYNPTLNKTFFTHSALVSFNRTSYKFGEEFVATIISQDREQRPKSFGGDYYRARLIRQKKNQPADGIPCNVMDNGDGTYMISAPLRLKGSLMLEVKLVNSVEGLREIVNKTENLITWRMRFVATLESNETVTCNVQLSNRQVKFSNKLNS